MKRRGQRPQSVQCYLRCGSVPAGLGLVSLTLWCFLGATNGGSSGPRRAREDVTFSEAGAQPMWHEACSHGFFSGPRLGRTLLRTSVLSVPLPASRVPASREESSVLCTCHRPRDAGLPLRFWQML